MLNSYPLSHIGTATPKNSYKFLLFILLAVPLLLLIFILLMAICMFKIRGRNKRPTRKDISTHNEHDSQLLIHRQTKSRRQKLDDFSDTHPPTPDNGNMTEVAMSIDSLLLDDPVSSTDNISPVLLTTIPQPAERVNEEPQHTNVLVTPPSHVTATETDQYTKDNELHPLKTSVAIATEGEDHQNIAGRNSGEIFQATPQPENLFLPRYSADLYNTAQHIPEWVHPLGTLTDCTSDGRSYYDEHNDFRLEIPEGAIPEGERVTIDIGVALYGPYQYPEGHRPVSPVFWGCVRGQENFRFLKPVKITIEHCLRLDRDTDTHSLGLTFLKAGHTLNSAGKYELQSADGAQDFQSDLSHGTLTTDHLWFPCIEATDDHETAKRNGYFLIPAYVNPIIARENQVMQFFITLKLKCCIETVKIRCRDKGYEYNFLSFYFNLEDNADGDLTIKYTCTEPEMWNICLQSSRTVSIPVIATNHL